MNNNLLETYAKTILENGPDRLLECIHPDIIFIRYDGWSLGCPFFLSKAGYHLYWKGEWIGFIRFPNKIPQPIEEYE